MDHANIPEAGLHEPKGVSTAAAGTAYIADGAGSGSWVDPIPADLPKMGWVNYADYATSITPQPISATTWTKLTNDTLGSQTLTTYLPTGVSSLWDSVNNQIDLTELAIGDEVEFRLNFAVTTSAANQVVQGRLAMAVGHGSAYMLNEFLNHYKTAGTYNMSVYNGLYIANNYTISNPAEIQIYTDATATVVVSGWYFKIIKR